MRTTASSLMAILAIGLNAQAATIVFQGSEKQTTLLELYTSEGCSSCPPAEAWLSRLKNAPGLWKEFVPVAFHVDYWDHLALSDPWSAGAYTDRQRTLARASRSDNIYTPGFVLNGREWREWFQSKDLPAVSAKAGVLRLSSDETNGWHVSFTPAASGNQLYEVHAALLSSDLSSDVKAEENRGRRLNHDFVALMFVKAPLARNDQMLRGNVTLDAKAKPNEGRLGLAVWVTLADRLEPIQAAGGWLEQFNGSEFFEMKFKNESDLEPRPF